MNIDDIPGTRAVKKKSLNYETRDHINYNDVEGSCSKKLHVGK